MNDDERKGWEFLAGLAAAERAVGTTIAYGDAEGIDLISRFTGKEYSVIVDDSKGHPMLTIVKKVKSPEMRNIREFRKERA